VIKLSRRRNIRSVPVVDDGKVIGIVTDGDIRQMARANPLFRDEEQIRRYTEQLIVTAVMTAHPMTIAPPGEFAAYGSKRLIQRATGRSRRHESISCPDVLQVR
jgi:CBS-domain-containing membrane protein